MPDPADALTASQRRGAYPADRDGLHELTGAPEEMGRFRIPSLRNVAATAPYMRDGSVVTLEDVVRLYEAGGCVIERGVLAGDGRANPYEDPRVAGFSLTDAERADLVAFLEALTDEAFLGDQRLASPLDP